MRSINLRVKVIELSEFLELRGRGPVIDHVLHLQSPKWGEGEEFKWDPSVVPTDCDFGSYPGSCMSSARRILMSPGAAYQKGSDGQWRGLFWGQGSSITAKELSCFKVMGDSHIIFDRLVKTAGDVIAIARFECLTSVTHGGKDYWRIRARYHALPSLQCVPVTLIQYEVQPGACDGGDAFPSVRDSRAIPRRTHATWRLSLSTQGPSASNQRLSRADQGLFYGVVSCFFNRLFARLLSLDGSLSLVFDSLTDVLQAEMRRNNVSVVFLASDISLLDPGFLKLEKANLNFFRYPGGQSLSNIPSKKPLFTEVGEWLRISCVYSLRASARSSIRLYALMLFRSLARPSRPSRFVSARSGTFRITRVTKSRQRLAMA